MSASSGARVVLLCLIGVLLVILGFLIAFAVMLRKRPSAPPRWIPHRAAPASSPPSVAAASATPVPAASAGSGAVASAVPSASVSGAPASRSSVRVCPTCRREYRGGLAFCPHDARPLVTPEELPRAGNGGTCPTCRRSFDPGVRYCPHDASELVAAAVYSATTPSSANGRGPAGVIAKVCPRCGSRYDLAATFCGKDGETLETLN